MASYDSDSSDGGEFEETNVLLGYASKDADEDTISRLGGQPEWLDPETPPSAALARCKVCGDMMALILQLNGELPERFPEHDRRIYVFACRRAGCRRRDGSVRALRGVRVWKEVKPEEKKEEVEEVEVEEKEEEKGKKDDGPGLGAVLFGTGLGGGKAAANPFSSGGNPFSSGAGANPFSSQPAKPAVTTEKPAPASPTPAPTPATAPATTASTSSLPKTFAESLNIKSTPPPPPPPPTAEPWPTNLPTPYPTLYLADADYETLDPSTSKPTIIPQHARLESADAPEPSVLDREAFESAMDATFQKFADRLAQNPEQAIRYEFAGQPLLYSKADVVGGLVTGGKVPRCGVCGGRRTFEVQLTPNAILELEGDDLSLDGMEWGTVLVFVCEADCSPRGFGLGTTGYVEEWAGVQWEELTGKKK